MNITKVLYLKYKDRIHETILTIYPKYGVNEISHNKEYIQETKVQSKILVYTADYV